MLKKTITYKDYNGVMRTKDYYFGLNKAEVNDLDLTIAGGLENFIDAIGKENDSTKLYKLFKDFIRVSYGIKSADGEYFEKGEDLFKKFTFTEAYSVLMMDILSSEENAMNFIIGVLPEEVQAEIGKQDVKAEVDKYKQERENRTEKVE